MSSCKKTDIVVVLDSSGSMETMGDEPKEAINQFVKEQREVDDSSGFTLWVFNNYAEKIYDNVPLSDVEKFTDWFPQGMTALNDSLYMAIDEKLKSDNPSNTVCIILTDGEENSSQKINSKQLKKKISEAEKKYNWKFIYMGANQDAFAVGSELGILNTASYAPNSVGLRSVSATASEAIKSYRLNVYKGVANPVLRSISTPCEDISNNARIFCDPYMFSTNKKSNIDINSLPKICKSLKRQPSWRQ